MCEKMVAFLKTPQAMSSMNMHAKKKREEKKEKERGERKKKA